MIQYTLAGRLESGELADLYRATRSDGRSVVVKLFHQKTSDPAYARELAKTVRQLSAVKHAGLVQVFELGLVKRRLAVVSDDVGRFTLGQALTRLNTKEVLLAPGLAVAMVLEMLDAMALAHHAGVMHGALTPGNVLLTADGHTAVRDFGALKALFASQALAKQFGGRGRSAYRAPENTKGDDLGIEGDIYSVGAIAYVLLTLKEPSAGDGPNVSTRRGAVPPPSRVDRRLNPRLDPVVLRALDGAPGRRYKTAQDFAQALRDFLAANGGLPSRDEHVRFVSTLFPAEVNTEHLGPPLFTESFSLDEVTGADLPALDGPLPEPAPRRPFISSELPTQNALPMLDDSRLDETAPESDAGGPKTLPELPSSVPEPGESHQTVPLARVESGQFPSWVAPAAAGPVKKAGAAAQESDSGTRALERRVRVIEDFQALEKKPAAPDPGKQTGADSGPIPRERLVLPTQETPRVDDAQPPRPLFPPVPSAPPRVVTEEKLIRAQAAERRKIGLWALAIAALGAGGFYYLIAQSDARVIPQWRVLPGKDGKDAPTVKAPPFRPDLRKKDDEKDKDKAADAVRPVAKDKDKSDPPPRASNEDCYDAPPRKKSGLLTVATQRGMSVRIDGVKVCGTDFTRIPVEPGKRKITVAEGGKNKETFEAVQRFEVGKEVRVVPVFHGR